MNCCSRASSCTCSASCARCCTIVARSACGACDGCCSSDCASPTSSNKSSTCCCTTTKYTSTSGTTIAATIIGTKDISAGTTCACNYSSWAVYYTTRASSGVATGCSCSGACGNCARIAII